MKTKTLDWLKQRTTWLGFAAAVITVLGTVEAPWAATATQVAIAVLSALGLALPDRKKLG